MDERYDYAPAALAFSLCSETFSHGLMLLSGPRWYEARKKDTVEVNTDVPSARPQPLPWHVFNSPWNWKLVL
jgi:hypothetical protein